jgi:hypothetical protein
MASAELSRRVERIVCHRPLVDMDDRQRREFHEALLNATPARAGSERGIDPQGSPHGRLSCHVADVY